MAAINNTEELTLLRKELAIKDSEIAELKEKLNENENTSAEKEHLLKQYAIIEAIVQSSESPVFVVDRNYCYLAFNKSHAEAIRNLFGVDIYLGQNLLNHHSTPAYKAMVIEELDRVLTGEVISNSNWHGKSEFNEHFYEVIRKPLYIDGKIEGVIISAVNFTEITRYGMLLRDKQKQLEEAQHLAHIGNWYLNNDTGEMHWSREIFNILGLEEISNEPSFKELRFVFVPESWDMLTESIFQILRTHKPFNIELQFYRNDGRFGWVNARSEVAVDNKGRAFGFFGTIQDITERKQLDAELTEIHQRLASLIEVSPLSIIVLDEKDCVEIWNPASEKIFGWTAEEVLGKHNPIVPKKEKESYLKIRENIFTGERIIAQEVVRQRKDGTEITVNLSTAPIKDPKGKVIGRMAIIADITQKIMAEKQARDSEEKYRLAFETSPDAVNINKFDGTYVDVNEGFVALTGYKAEEVIGLLSLELEIWARQTDREKLIQGLKEKGKVENLETLFRCKDGALRTGLMSASLVSINNEPHILSITRDITNRKAIEDELVRTRETAIENKARIDSVLRAANIGFVIIDFNGNLLEWNDTFRNFFGYNNEEFRLLSSSLITYAEDREISAKSIKSMARGEINSFRIEKRFVHKDGSIFWVDLFASPLIKNNKSSSVVGIVQDITERRKAEDLLRQSEAGLRKAQEVAHMGSWQWDVKTGIFQGSEESCHILGAENQKINSDFIKQIVQSIHPEDQYKYEKIRNTILSGTKPPPFEIRIIFNNGEIRIIKVEVGEHVFDNEGKSTYLSGIIQDITEQKCAEKALKESEERFRKLVESVTDYIYTVRIENNQVTQTMHGPGCLGVTGYSQFEFANNPYLWFNIIYPNDRELVQEHINKFSPKVKYEALEHRIIHKDGSVRWIQNAQVHQFDEAGNLTGYDGLITDISRRKEVEEALRESEELFRKLSDASPLAIFRTDGQGRLIYTNERYYEISGVTHDDVCDTEWRLNVHPDDLDVMFERMQDSIRHKKTISGEFRYKKKTGNWIYVYYSTVPLFSTAGEFIGFVGACDDVTDRKETERRIVEAIIEAEERERKRFSRDLHDGLGPLLSTAKLYFQWLSDSENIEQQKLLSKKGNHNLDEAIQSLREISNNLSPRLLTNFGLVTALKHLIDDINEAEKITIEFVNNCNYRFEPNVEVNIYRIISELINNTIKHADAKQVYVTLRHNSNTNILEVGYTDDGRGFDLQLETENSKGLGLINIQNRVASLHGHIQMESYLEKGMKVNIEIVVNPIN
jgi:PAS domain S-box-containing protein